MKSETNKFGTVLSLSIKFIKDRYSAILYVNGKKHSGLACENKQDIGYICRDLLRWYSKLGGVSEWAESSRNSQRNRPGPIGKIFHKEMFRD